MEDHPEELQRLIRRSRLMDLTQDILLVLDIAGKVLDANQAAADLHGVPVASLIGRNVTEFLHETSGREMYEIAARMVQCAKDCSDTMRVRAVRHDGSVADLELRVTWSNADQHFYVVERDVTEVVARTTALEELSKSLATQALTDGLTGIANRAAFSQHLAVIETCNTTPWLVVVDVDCFKSINDRHGHAAGDAVLVAVAERMRAGIRSTDLVARIGGDEFVMVIDAGSVTELETRVEQVRDELSSDYQVADRMLSVSCSLGAARRHEDEPNETWQSRADRYMYRSKQLGRNQLSIA